MKRLVVLVMAIVFAFCTTAMAAPPAAKKSMKAKATKEVVKEETKEAKEAAKEEAKEVKEAVKEEAKEVKEAAERK